MRAESATHRERATTGESTKMKERVRSHESTNTNERCDLGNNKESK